MKTRSREIVGIVFAVAMICGCSNTLPERLSPEIKEVRNVVNLGICHGADLARMAAIGVGNVIGHSVGGFVNLTAKEGLATSNPVGLMVLGVASGVYGPGVGIIKTVEDWEPGIEDCLAGNLTQPSS